MWIKSKNLPAITGLVVKQKQGTPSTGFWDIEDKKPCESWLIQQLNQAQATKWEKLINELNTTTIQKLSVKLDSGSYGKK